jgi:ATP-dependent Clp protease adapter protein ClpS
MAVVTEVLSQIFKMSELRATYLMWVAHRLGRAVVWSSERTEAERLAASAASYARNKGTPLRVSVEESNGGA